MSDELKCISKICWWREAPDENCYPCKDLRGYRGSASLPSPEVKQI